MKNSIILLAIFVLTSLTAYTQGTVTTSQITLDKQTHKAVSLKMDIPTKDSKNLFVDFMKQRYDVKVDAKGFLSKKNDLVLEEEEIPLLSAKKIDMFINFQDRNEQVTNILLAGRFSNDDFFSDEQDPEMFQKLEKLVNDFRLFAQQKHFSMTLEKQTKMQADMTKELKNAKEDIAKNKKNIEKNLEENEKMKKENATLEKESSELNNKLEDIKTKISASKKALENVK